MEEEYKILPVEEAETVIFDSAIDFQDPAGKKSIIARIGNLGVFFCEKILATGNR